MNHPAASGRGIKIRERTFEKVLSHSFKTSRREARQARFSPQYFHTTPAVLTPVPAPGYSSRIKTFIAVLAVAITTLFLHGCGGGGAGGDIPTTPSSNYTLLSLASAEVGPAGETITVSGASLDAALADSAEITVCERSYPAGRPSGTLTRVFDIQPDALPFEAGTRLCISYDGTGYDGSDLVIVTGENLDEELATTDYSSTSRVCAELQHSSPYSVKRARSLSVPDYTIFGDLSMEESYTYKIETGTDTDSDRGTLQVFEIYVDCAMKCMESGRRIFKLSQGGNYDGGLFIYDQGTYPMWLDAHAYEWTDFTNEQGALNAGVAYLLAAEYIDFFVGSGVMSSYIDQLDPAYNIIQRNFYEEDAVQPYLYIEITRDDTNAPGVITVFVKRSGSVDRTYIIDRSTVAITEEWNTVASGRASVTFNPGETGYEDEKTKLLTYVYYVLGLDDTPDYTGGNAWDEHTRLTPNQELFATNVMNLVKGLGWGNLAAIEAYYRDRNELL